MKYQNKIRRSKTSDISCLERYYPSQRGTSRKLNFQIDKETETRQEKNKLIKVAGIFVFIVVRTCEDKKKGLEKKIANAVYQHI